MFGSLLGSVGKALFGGGNRAAKKTAQGYSDAQAAMEPILKEQIARFDPYAQAGQESTGLIRSLLGMDPSSTAGAEGLARFRDSTGYQDTLNAALGGAATNAAARGLLGSSGTGKVFQNTASQLAQGSFGDFLNRLMQQQGVGLSAAGTQAQVGSNLAQSTGQNILGNAQALGQKKSFLGRLFS